MKKKCGSWVLPPSSGGDGSLPSSGCPSVDPTRAPEPAPTSENVTQDVLSCAHLRLNEGCMDVLQLDVSGRPQAWLSARDAALLYATDEVAWTIGDPFTVLRGGIQRHWGCLHACHCIPLSRCAAASPTGPGGRSPRCPTPSCLPATATCAPTAASTSPTTPSPASTSFPPREAAETAGATASPPAATAMGARATAPWTS